MPVRLPRPPMPANLSLYMPIGTRGRNVNDSSEAGGLKPQAGKQEIAHRRVEARQQKGRGVRAPLKSCMSSSGLTRIQQKQRLPVLDRLTILDENLDDAPALLRLDFVHQLHRLDNTEYVTRFYRLTLPNIGFRAR